MTIFDEAGMRGLNFAFMDGSAHYHTEHDSISRLDRASVQDMGDAALAAARRLGGADLSQNGTDATYFSLFGTIVSYPAWLTPSLAVMVVLGMFLLLWFGRCRGLSPGGAGRAAATFPLTLIGAAAIGLAGWWVLSRVRPDFALTEGSVHHGGRYLLGGALLLLVLLVAWYRWARRKASPLDIAVGVLGWFALLAVVCAVLLPEGAYLFTWPALIGPAVVAMTLRFTAEQSPWRAVAVTATAVPAVALLLPVVLLLLPAFGLSSTAAPLVLAALLGALLLSLLELLPSRRTVTAGMLAVAVAGVGTLVVGTALDGYDADEPRPVSLGYALESDTGKATWVSLGDTSQPDIGELLTGEPARYDDRIPRWAAPHSRTEWPRPPPWMPRVPRTPRPPRPTVSARSGSVSRPLPTPTASTSTPAPALTRSSMPPWRARSSPAAPSTRRAPGVGASPTPPRPPKASTSSSAPAARAPCPSAWCPQQSACRTESARPP
ncbi:M28 family peptidase [Streptomyces sp. ML-6]|uniref:M28 family peptidase n=1 Tax=Streptomyces sp. ML-6 TaxID=2982693 RepID=UPI0024C006FC|nr:M28 family peptidase [Streptomyces sp. ML-6]MDK0524127.1 hypothetical protein [Streptomyces sp. ML-6]